MVDLPFTQPNARPDPDGKAGQVTIAESHSPAPSPLSELGRKRRKLFLVRSRLLFRKIVGADALTTWGSVALLSVMAGGLGTCVSAARGFEVGQSLLIGVVVLAFVGFMALTCAGFTDRETLCAQKEEFEGTIDELNAAVKDEQLGLAEKLRMLQQEQAERVAEKQRLGREQTAEPAKSLSVAPASRTPSVLRALGTNGQLELLQDRVRITRDGFAAFLLHGPLKGAREILISQVSAIEFQDAGALLSGYIRFSHLGGTQPLVVEPYYLFGKAQAIANDENAVSFRQSEQGAFEAIKRAIEQRMTTRRPAGNAPSNLDELEKLASLRTRGIITEEEFAAKKRQLLGL